MYPPDDELSDQEPEFDLGGEMAAHDEQVDSEMSGEPGMEEELPEEAAPLEEELVEPEEEEVEEPDDTEVQNIISGLTQQYDVIEQPVRESRSRMLKLLDLYWQGLTNWFWSEALMDWRPITSDDLGEDGELPKTINVYKPYGESIIAALSAAVPKTRFYPEDADNYDDIVTAKTKSVIVDKVELDNEAELLLMKALFIIFNQGPVAAYIKSENYGKSEKKPVMGQQEKQVDDFVCPQCGAPMMPSMEQMAQCESCGFQGQPINDPKVEIEEVIERHEELYRKKICIELYGAFHFFVPAWVRTQKETPYIGCDYEADLSWAKDTYTNVADSIQGTPSPDTYLRWARLTSQYIDQSTTQLVTIRKRWYRPWAYNMLAAEQAELLKTRFPRGLFVTYVNDQIAEYKEEELDDVWHISENPLYNDIFGQPMGRGLVDVQDLSDELLNLTRDTVAQGIGVTFADPSVLDIQKWRQSRARPGDVFPTKPSLNKNISDGFYQTTVANLSQEVDRFVNRIEMMAQFTSGAYPSIYGGVQKSGSGTFGEYESNKNQALQRLQINWRVLGNWWAQLMSKAANLYIKTMEVEEDKYVSKVGNQFVNNWIKKSELQGSIGLVRAEYNEQFPISWSQKKDIVTNLLTLGNEQINMILGRPENSSLISSILGLSEIFIPGEDDRNKQLWEILELIKTSDQFQPSIPVPPGMDPEMAAQQGMGLPPQPTVPIEPETDDDEVHVAVCKEILNSEKGILLKQTNDNAYQNILAHLRQHVDKQAQDEMNEMMKQSQMQQMGMTPPPEEGGEVPPEETL